MGASEIWLVRHGESEANVVATEAQRAGEERIVVEWRDADVPLSPTGREQAGALGVWLGENASGRSPVVWSSPYRRARETTAIALAGAGAGAEAGMEAAVPVRVDERLRDRELGILDLLTAAGVQALHPEEAERRRWLGKFYYRPPGGESWADVALRIRSFLRDAEDSAPSAQSGPLLVVAHDAVVMLFLFVCLGWSEEELLGFARENVVVNASITRLVRADGAASPTSAADWQLAEFAHHGHLDRLDVEATRHGGDTDESAEPAR
ncbi:histidine phosphatase family protein [Herbiconiux sp. CPCC 203407]|uniref:Histidine phosphatase family protein n=1 Tax=Herbiconiux oxytropis TaxID=2970915 RepID=A0AA42BW46_9MICO|nr:histidine phosphatase family protein [Herbiconiux oxytropis]MCS5723563.1 histidine phosphatase family protein [Herbiconiux oxytropis]MCS5727489.1 histidine phosphatase family protein [Herbiconiux oxytropis]